MGLMEDELDQNINEVISLRSKSNSIQRISDVNIKVDNNHELRKSKGINKNYCKNFILMNISEKFCLIYLFLLGKELLMILNQLILL